MTTVRDWLTARGLAAMLWWKSRPGLVRGALARRTFQRAAPPSRDRVTVGLAQMRMELVSSAADYALKAYRLTRAAVERGAQLVVFPEYASASLVGLLPGAQQFASRQSMQDVMQSFARLAPAPALLRKAGEGKRAPFPSHSPCEAGGAGGGREEGPAQSAGAVSVGDVFRVIAPAARRIHAETFSTLAQRFGIHLVAGTIILPDKDGQLYSHARLFAPDGQLVGVQHKLHLFTSEEEWLTPGNELRVFDLPFGHVAMPICMDYTYWETARLAYLAGAEILIDPAADDAGDDEWLAARGIRMRVQESPCYGLHVFVISDAFGLHWRGRSSVYAPVGLLPPGQRTLAQAESNDQEEIVVCDLDMAALRTFRADHAPDFNVPLYNKYLPRVYADYTCPAQAQPPAGRGPSARGLCQGRASERNGRRSVSATQLS